MLAANVENLMRWQGFRQGGCPFVGAAPGGHAAGADSGFEDCVMNFLGQKTKEAKLLQETARCRYIRWGSLIVNFWRGIHFVQRNLMKLNAVNSVLAAINYRYRHASAFSKTGQSRQMNLQPGIHRRTPSEGILKPPANLLKNIKLIFKQIIELYKPFDLILNL